MATVGMLASNAVKAPLEVLCVRFADRYDHQITARYHTAVAVAQRILEGEDFDVAVLPADQIDNLAQQDKLVPPSFAPLAVAAAGVVIREGGRAIDTGSVDALMRALLEAKSIALVETGAVGIHFKSVFQRLRLLEQLTPKIRWLPSTDHRGHVPQFNPAALAVANGEAEIGMTQVSEILSVPGVKLAGLLPPDIELRTTYAAAISHAAKHRAAAAALVTFLASTATAAATYTENGLEPLR